MPAPPPTVAGEADGKVPDAAVIGSGRGRGGLRFGAAPPHPLDLSGWKSVRPCAKDTGQIGGPAEVAGPDVDPIGAWGIQLG